MNNISEFGSETARSCRSIKFQTFTHPILRHYYLWHVKTYPGADPYRFPPFYGNRSDFYEWLKNKNSRGSMSPVPPRTLRLRLLLVRKSVTISSKSAPATIPKKLYVWIFRCHESEFELKCWHTIYKLRHTDENKVNYQQKLFFTLYLISFFLICSLSSFVRLPSTP